MGFQVMQSVIVTNEKLDLHGKAGYVVEAVGDHDTAGKVSVKMDVDGEVYEFDQSDVKAL
jgi:hypothetical protein